MPKFSTPAAVVWYLFLYIKKNVSSLNATSTAVQMTSEDPQVGESA
eukprot:SAG11_NODE_32134_length_286_cov_0.727273_1_plen_45_part_10